jgi:hypothetical protein
VGTGVDTIGAVEAADDTGDAEVADPTEDVDASFTVVLSELDEDAVALLGDPDEITEEGPSDAGTLSGWLDETVGTAATDDPIDPVPEDVMPAETVPEDAMSVETVGAADTDVPAEPVPEAEIPELRDSEGRTLAVSEVVAVEGMLAVSEGVGTDPEEERTSDVGTPEDGTTSEVGVGTRPVDGSIPEDGRIPDERGTPEDGNTPEERGTPEDGNTPDERASDVGTPEDGTISEVGVGTRPVDGSIPEDGRIPDERGTPEDGKTPVEGSIPEEGSTPEEGKIPEDGKIPDGSALDGTIPDEGKAPDGSTLDGKIPDGSALDGRTPDDGKTPEANPLDVRAVGMMTGAVPEGRMDSTPDRMLDKTVGRADAGTSESADDRIAGRSETNEVTAGGRIPDALAEGTGVGAVDPTPVPEGVTPGNSETNEDRIAGKSTESEVEATVSEVGIAPELRRGAVGDKTGAADSPVPCGVVVPIAVPDSGCD